MGLPHHERITDPDFRRAVALIDDGDATGLAAHLAAHPGMAARRVRFEGEDYFTNPALLGFVAGNPVRNDALPPNIAEVTQVILDAGGDDRAAVGETLALVASGRVPRECGVQRALIALLCRYGADPDEAMAPALTHGEWEAVEALLEAGAHRTLPVAAALGDTARAEMLLDASAGERHLALALATQHGRLSVVEMLLDAGEDPGRYNPEGAHSHSTPLHQAVWGGHLDVVRLLVERGVRRDLKDMLWQGTPLDWAEYGGQRAIADYLRGLDS